MPSLTRLALLHQSLTASIARLDKKPKQVKGLHLGRDGLVSGHTRHKIAWPRQLVWTAFLHGRVPTKQSLEKTGHRLRGMWFWQLAYRAQQQGKPLPVREGHTPPDTMLPAPPWLIHERARRPMVTRQDDGTDQSFLNDLAAAPNDIPDAVVAWWDAFGWDAGLDPSSILTPEDYAAWQQARETYAANQLNFDSWLETALGDLMVMQVLDAYWNGQASLFASQETANWGLAGAFNVNDSNIGAFLLQNAGNWITAIDDTTRNVIAVQLWDGIGNQMMSVQAVARDLRSVLSSDYQNLPRSLQQAINTRANMIAVTETARAETFGQFASYLKNGVRFKQWMASAGACTICADNELQGSIPIFSEFPSGGFAPPSHPLCRCALGPGFNPEGNGAFKASEWGDIASPSFIDNLLADPSMAQWPNVSFDPGVIDSYTNAAPPPSPVAGQELGLLQFNDLPQGLQDSLDPGVIDALGAQLGGAASGFADTVAADLGLGEDPMAGFNVFFDAAGADAEPVFDQAQFDAFSQQLGSIVDQWRQGMEGN